MKYNDENERSVAVENVDALTAKTIEEIKSVWTAHKEKSEKVAGRLMDSDDIYLARRAERMMECGDDVNVHWQSDHRWISAKRCRDRLCPLCAWRMSITRHHALKKVFDSIMAEGNRRFAFVTLTVKNCNAKTLRYTIDMINGAWREMTRHAAWKKTYAGFYRALEITYNATEDTYHPHLHIIAEIAKGRTVDEPSIRASWKTALAAGYDPIIEAHEIIPTQRGDIRSALVEVSRYTLSPSMLEDAPLKVLEAIAKYTASVKAITAGGTLKKHMKKIVREVADKTPEAETARTSMYWNPADQSYIVRHKKYE